MVPPHPPQPGFGQQGAPPPGVPAQWQPPAGRPQALRSIGVATQILLGVMILVALGYLVSAFDQLTLLQRLTDDFNSVSYAEIDASDNAALVVTLLFNACALATGVVFIVWFYRVRKNAGVWSPATQRRSQGWSIWGWICPIVNFGFPYQIAQDGLAVAKPFGSKPGDGLGTLRAWWVLWVISVAFSFLERVQTRQAETIEQLVRSVQTDIASTLFYLPAGVFAILVVRKITLLQDQRINWEQARFPTSGN